MTQVTFTTVRNTCDASRTGRKKKKKLNKVWQRLTIIKFCQSLKDNIPYYKIHCNIPGR